MNITTEDSDQAAASRIADDLKRAEGIVLGPKADGAPWVLPGPVDVLSPVHRELDKAESAVKALGQAIRERSAISQPIGTVVEIDPALKVIEIIAVLAHAGLTIRNINGRLLLTREDA